MRNLTLVIGLLAVQSAAGSVVICAQNSWPADTASLDEAYAAHSIVFVANVSTIVDPETTETTWSYRLLPPALKGDIPSEGILNVEMRSCLMPHLALEATMLIFLDNLDESAKADNSVAVVYGDGNVVEKWIVEWAAEKLDDR
jgi:hypothetical protein